MTRSGTFTRVIVRIAVAAIAVSLAVMILTTAIIAGFKSEITDKIFGFWGHIHITDSNVNRTFELVPINKDEKYYDQIRNIRQIEYQENAEFMGIPLSGKVRDKVTLGGVKGVYPYTILPALLSTKQNFHGVLIKGVDSQYDWQRMQKYVREGTMPGYAPDSASTDLLISKNIAERMHLSVGDKVILSFIRDNDQIRRRFRICGIYNTGLEEYDRRFCIADLAKVQEILKWSPSQVQGMEVELDDMKDLGVISEYVYYEILPQQLYAETIRSKFPSIFEWLGLQDINEKIILQLMIVVAIINMVTVLLILILERTQMIGILKSLGMSNWNVRKIFVWNAAYIVLYGIAIGNIAGLGLAWLQKRFGIIRLDEANYYLDTAPIKINLWTVLLLNAGTLAIIVLALLLPTLLVTRITPVKALRFE